MKKSRLMAILLCLVLLLPLVACGSTQNSNSSPAAGGTSPSGSSQDGASPSQGSAAGASDTAASGKDTITVALRSDAGSLSPATINTDTFNAVTCIMQPLWDVDENNNVIMLLAESVDKVSDTEWKVHLRHGVTFSNGNPFTADDVIFSIKLHKDNGATGGPRVQTLDVDKTKALDDYTVDLVMPIPAIHNWTVMSECIIYDKESYDETKAGLNPIGTGPYVLKEYVPNSYINLDRREDYWGTKPDAKHLNFRILGETSQRVNALETGLVDVAPLATQDVDYVKGLPEFNVDTRYTGNYIVMGFNFGTKSAFYHNLDARKAITHAVNPQAIVDTVFQGHGKVMHSALPDLCFDYESRFDNMDDTYKIGYNVDLAKQLATSSGIAGKTLKIITDGSAEAISEAQIIQNMLSEVGVNLEINNYDTATVWQMMYDPDAEYDLTIGAGIAPNRRVGDLLLNTVRYSPTISATGAFDGVEDYLEKAPTTMSTIDDKQRSDILFDMLGRFEANVIDFALCNVEYSNAFSKAIDQSSVVYSVGVGAPRYEDLKFAS